MIFGFLPEIRAQNSGAFPRLTPDPKALEYFRPQAARNYTWRELAEISLWASGDTSASNLRQIENAVILLNSSSALPYTPRERAEFILSFLHSSILRTYSLYQTRVDTIFTNGRFNCVSSSVLYMILCKSAGLNTSGVMTREHAFIIVHIDGQDIDVETTNRYGFDPGNRREFHDQFGRLTGFTYVPAQNYRDRQTIGQIELVSLILNNRIAEHERANRFADAVPLAVDRAALLYGSTLAVNEGSSLSSHIFDDPRNDLVDRLFNYGAYLLRSNREEEALGWAAAAGNSHNARWQEFILAAVNNRVARYARDRKLVNARNFLEENRNHLTRENYAQIDAILTDAELLIGANGIRTAADGESVIRLIEQTRENGRISAGRADELIVFSLLRTAFYLSSPPDRDWRAAIRYLESAPVRFAANREVEQALDTYRGNLASDYHNRFAAEWNRRNYDEAQRILNEALIEFPANRQLLSDREIVNRHNSR